MHPMPVALMLRAAGRCGMRPTPNRNPSPSNNLITPKNLSSHKQRAERQCHGDAFSHYFVAFLIDSF
jgi:hypothetical protein